MSREQRLALYTRELRYKTADGIYRLTPAQRRRCRRKFNRQQRRDGAEWFDPGGWHDS